MEWILVQPTLQGNWHSTNLGIYSKLRATLCASWDRMRIAPRLDRRSQMAASLPTAQFQG